MEDPIKIQIKTELNTDDVPKQLRTLENNLSKSDDGALKITARLDIDATERIINQQLKTLKIDSSVLKITPQLDISGKTGSQGLQQIQESANKAQQSVNQLHQKLLDIDKTSADFKFNVAVNDEGMDLEKTLQNARDLFSKYKDIQNIKLDWGSDETGELKRITAELTATSGQIEKINFELNEMGGSFLYKSSASSESGIIKTNQEMIKQNETLLKQYANIDAYITTAQSSAQKIRAKWSDINGGSSVQDTAHLSALQSKYAELMMTIESLRGADENTLKTLKANIKSQEAELNSLVSSYHNAEKVATDLRTKGFETVKDITGSKIDTLEQSIVNTLGSTEKLSAELGNIRSKFDELGKTELTQEAKATLLTQILDDIDKTNAKLGTLSEVEKSFKSLSTEMDSAYRSFKKFDDSSVLKNNFKSQDVIAFRDTVANLRAEYDKLNAELAQTPKTSANYTKLRTELDKLKISLDGAEEEYGELQTRLRTAGSEQQAEARLQRLTNKINEYMAANTKAARKYKDQFEHLLSQTAIKQDTDGIRRLEMEWSSLTSQIKIAGDQGKTFGQIIMDSAKRFSQWMTLTGVISTGWRELRKMVSTVIELDTAMTNLKKVSDETEATYSRFLKNSIKQAQELHSSVSDLIEQTTTWKKLGFDLNQSQQLSRASMIYANVGDVDNEQAVTNIVSAIKAFDIEVQDVMKIPDVYNRLGNEFAVSSKNLGSGMSKAASTLALMGSSFEEVAALLTGSGEILGDNRLEEIGNGLRVVTLRIMNQAGALQELNEEYEDLESVSKTQQQIYEYTRGQVNIMSDLDPNTFKKPYEILKEIAEIFDDLNQTEQSQLIQLLFGKNRADVGTSLIKAFQSGQIQKALEAAENSAGSAEKEFANFEKSIESHLNDLTAAFQGLSSVVVNSELIKGFVDAGTGALNLLTDIISKFGTLQTLLPVVVAGLSAFKNVGRHKMSCLREYAHCNVVVTRNELMIA